MFTYPPVCIDLLLSASGGEVLRDTGEKGRCDKNIANIGYETTGYGSPTPFLPSTYVLRRASHNLTADGTVLAKPHNHILTVIRL